MGGGGGVGDGGEGEVIEAGAEVMEAGAEAWEDSMEVMEVGAEAKGEEGAASKSGFFFQDGKRDQHSLQSSMPERWNGANPNFIAIE